MQFSTQTVLGLVTALAFMGVVLGCPDGHACFRNPEGCGPGMPKMCEIMVAWKAVGATGDGAGTIQFIAVANHTVTGPQWLGIGFSTDGLMGEDDILICRQTQSSEVVLEHYWSTNTPKSILKETSQDVADTGITEVSTSYENNYINCNFTRAVSVSGNDRVYDLSEVIGAEQMPKYHWFFGVGPVQGSNPLQHGKDPYHTLAGVDIMATAEIMQSDVEGESSEEGTESPDSEEDDDGTAANVIASVMLLMAMACLAIYTV